MHGLKWHRGQDRSKKAAWDNEAAWGSPPPGTPRRNRQAWSQDAVPTSGQQMLGSSRVWGMQTPVRSNGNNDWPDADSSPATTPPAQWGGRASPRPKFRNSPRGAQLAMVAVNMFEPASQLGSAPAGVMPGGHKRSKDHTVHSAAPRAHNKFVDAYGNRTQGEKVWTGTKDDDPVRQPCMTVLWHTIS